MLALDQLLVCPVCHAALDLDQRAQSGATTCSSCAYRFSYRNGVFDLTPVPPPTADVASVWHVWEALQQNGLIAYEQDPEHNLSVGEREDAKAFARFCALTGLTLDIGCGPQREVPAYATVGPEYLIGLDPLRGVQPRDYCFVQGIAEYLPFPMACFDHVLFATSLDHMLNPQRTLAETKRVLKPSGKVNIWIFDATQRQSKWEVLQAQLKFNLALVRQGKLQDIIQRIGGRRSPPPATTTASQPQPAYLAEMSVPEGAIDQFHFSHPTQATITAWLATAGLTLVKVKRFKTYHLFLQAKP